MTHQPSQDQDLRTALHKAVSKALHDNQFADGWPEMVDPVVNAVLALTPAQAPEKAGEWEGVKPLGEDGPVNVNGTLYQSLRHALKAQFGPDAEFADTPTPPLSPDSTGPVGICHDDQLAIWSGDIIGSLGMGGYLREDISYEDKLHMYALVDAEIKGICAALTPSAPIAAPVRDDGAREAVARQIDPKAFAPSVLAYDGVWEDRRQDARKNADDLLDCGGPVVRAFLASLPAPAGDVPGEAQTQEGGR